MSALSDCLVCLVDRRNVRLKLAGRLVSGFNCALTVCFYYYYQFHQIKDDEIGGARVTSGGEENSVRDFDEEI